MTRFFGANVSISGDGTLVYVPGGVEAAGHTLVWVDRQGREQPSKAPPRAYVYPRLSPDATRVAVDTRDQENDIWIWDLARETLTRLTLDPGLDTHPAWTPDGQRVLFRSARAGPGNLYWQAADSTGAAERLTESATDQYPGSFSPDGTRMVFRDETAASGADLMVLALERGLRPQPPPSLIVGSGRSATSDVLPFVQATFNELNGEISPDGRWMAYQSNESGQDEVYVRPFPDADRGRWQVSTRGGTRPLWARSGKELFYLEPDGVLMTTSVEGGATFRVSSPTRLLEGPYTSPPTVSGRNYDVSPDGQQFLIVKAGGSPATNIIVVQNWTEELKRLVPTK